VLPGEDSGEEGALDSGLDSRDESVSVSAAIASIVAVESGQLQKRASEEADDGRSRRAKNGN
jgi:hypothetical protein